MAIKRVEQLCYYTNRVALYVSCNGCYALKITSHALCDLKWNNKLENNKV